MSKARRFWFGLGHGFVSVWAGAKAYGMVAEIDKLTTFLLFFTVVCAVSGLCAIFLLGQKKGIEPVAAVWHWILLAASIDVFWVGAIPEFRLAVLPILVSATAMCAFR